MKKKIKYFEYAFPIIITLFLLFIVFFFQKLYPLGVNSIVQVDADYQYIPVLYEIYDFLHGNVNIIYTNLGLGNNAFISAIIQGGIFSPINLLLYFTSRSNIVNYFNVLVIAKICLLSLTSYIYIKNSYKVNYFYKILFSVLYAFSGWILLNYFNIMWIDSVVLFPLIIMYLNKLIKDEKYIGYVITLSLSLVISYYISYFILIFILFYSFILIFLKLPNSKMKKAIYNLGLYTLIAILISSFSLIPALYQTFISSRFNYDSHCNFISDLMNKSLYLLLSPFFLIVFGKLLLKYKKNRKAIYCYFLLFLLFSIGIFAEPINLALHGGSYWCFPYRYSFLTLFILMSGSLYYFEKFEKKHDSKIPILKIILFLTFTFFSCFVYKSFIKKIVGCQLVLSFKNNEVYIYILIILGFILFAMVTSLCINNKYIKYVSLTIICGVQILMVASFTMQYSDGYYLSKNANDINNNFSFDKDKLVRYKMNYTNYTPDYGLIYKVSSLDNWLHVVPNGQVDMYKKLGYETNDTSVRSYGGTIFSDWLFNVKYFIDDKVNNDELFELVSSHNDYYLYKYNYNNKFGLIYNNFENIEYSENPFVYQNNIYKNLFSTNENLIDIKKSVIENDNEIDLNYELDGKKFVYIYFNDNYDNISSVTINDNSISEYDNYIKYLGIYDNSLDIKICYDSNIEIVDISVGFIDYNAIVNLSSKVNDVTYKDNTYYINVNSDVGTDNLFLPINNIPGLMATRNGKTVKIDSYLDNFVSIKLVKGTNNIAIKYEMPYFKIGIILSALGIILLSFIKHLVPNKIMLNFCYYIFIIIVISFYLYFYGYSFIKYMM